MDKKFSLKKASDDDVTRESLIALSYCVPDKAPDQKLSPVESNGEIVVEEIESDEADRCRSELISISYSQSPDSLLPDSPVKKSQPAPLEETRG